MKASELEELQQAFDDVLGAIRGAIAEPPPPLKKALARLGSALEALDDAEHDGRTETAEPLEHRRERESAGLSPVAIKPGRHDRKRVPSGFDYAAGVLLPLEGDEESRLRAATAAVRLISVLAHAVEVVDERGRHRPVVGALIDERLKELSDKKLSVLFTTKIASIFAAWEGFYGRPWEFPRWAWQLEVLLDRNARNVEERRLMQEHGHRSQTEEFATAPHGLRRVLLRNGVEEARIGEMVDMLLDALQVSTGEQLHAELKRYTAAEESLPPTLTPEVLAAMTSMVGVNGGGRGGKKTARAVVDAFIATLPKGGRSE